jgi:hypothetical protein
MSTRRAFLELAQQLANRNSRTGLRGLQEFSPVGYLEGAMLRLGGDPARATFATVPDRQIQQLGQAYADAPMFDERLLPAFDSMREATEQQFDFLTRPTRRGGLGVDVQVLSEDPFDVTTPEGLREMLNQLGDRRFQVLSTKATGGHPVLTDDQNDMFRAVHDAFGHAATGRGFGRHGEEGAFLAHSSMYPAEAVPALVSELRGQNAFLNRFGTFGPQKVAALPEQFVTSNPIAVSGAEEQAALVDAIQRMINAGRF